MLNIHERNVVTWMDKKELKKKYKQTLRPMGVYQIKNLVNGKIVHVGKLSMKMENGQ